MLERQAWRQGPRAGGTGIPEREVRPRPEQDRGCRNRGTAPSWVFCESVPFRLFVLLADSDEPGWGCLGERVRKKREKGSEQWEDE